MPADQLRLDLRCPACRWAQECGEADVAQWLRSQQMLKRNPHASREELRELLLAVAPRLKCPQCGATGLVASPSPEDSAGWPGSAKCEICGQLIPPERLEVFPETRICVKCQQKSERGQVAGETEYCPKCGAPMVLRATRGGVTRYTMVCTNNPPCRLS